MDIKINCFVLALKQMCCSSWQIFPLNIPSWELVKIWCFNQLCIKSNNKVGSFRNAFTPHDWAYCLLSCSFFAFSKHCQEITIGLVQGNLLSVRTVVLLCYTTVFSLFSRHTSVSSTLFIKNTSSVIQFSFWLRILQHWGSIRKKKKNVQNYWAEYWGENLCLWRLT